MAEEPKASGARRGRAAGAKRHAPRRGRSQRQDTAAGRPLVVGIGASAGGLAALTAFFDAARDAADLSFVVVQHLDPVHQSTLPQLIAAHTALRVIAAADSMVIEPATVYVIPPGTYVSIADRRLRVAKAEPLPVRLPIDHFLRTLAPAFKHRSAAVILTGTGSDGSLGVRAIKEAGGLTLVQNPEEAAYDGMPRSAIATGAADLILPVAEMPAALRHFADWPHGPPAQQRPEEPGLALAELLPQIIDVLKSATLHDFSLYKPATLIRRIERRIALQMVEGPGAYVAFLRRTPAEQEALFQDLLINVTNFFRDPAAFEFLEKSIIPELVATHDDSRPLRIWVPGCSSGEEAYSIAMLLIEAMSAAGKNIALQVFATDVDTVALDIGRRGIYPDSIQSDVTADRLQRFFKRQDSTFVVQPRLRECLVFAQQNLLADAPFSTLDLVSCRNLLIYLRPEVQERVLRLLHFSLMPGGILFLGPSETIAGERARFEAISQKFRIFRRVGRSRPADLSVPIRTDLQGTSPSARLVRPFRRTSLAELCQQALVQGFAPASVLVDAAGHALHYVGEIDRFLRIASGDASQQISQMARGGLRARLGAAIREAQDGDGNATVGGAYLRDGNQTRPVVIEVRPVQDQGERLQLISFVEQPSPATGSGEPPALAPEEASAQVARLEQELGSTRNELESSIRDLETSNEELRAANEEAMSLNEEFQSTNEELETSKEELQSLNEELTTVNAELQEKVESTRRTADDLRNLLAATDIATLFLDRELRIRFYTPAAKELFAVIDSDIGRPLSDLARWVNDPGLLQDCEQVMKELVPIQREVRGENRRWFNRRIGPYRAEDGRISGVIVTFVEVTEFKTSVRVALEATDLADGIIGIIRQPLLVLGADLRAVLASPSFYRTFQLSPEDVVGRPIGDIAGGVLKAPAPAKLLERMQSDPEDIEDVEVELTLPYGRRSFLFNAKRMPAGGGNDGPVLLAMEDITERVRSIGDLVRQTLEASPDAVVLVGPDGLIVDVNERGVTLFGYTADDLRGERIEMLMPQRFHRKHRQHLKDFFAQPLPRLMGVDRGLDIVGLTRDGRELPLQVSLTLVPATTGPLALAAIRDVSAEHEAARILQEAKTAAEEASQHKSEFLATTSQNLRRPLQTLATLIGALQRAAVVPEVIDLAGRLGIVVSTMTDVLSTLLDLDRLERGELDPAVTDFLVHDTLERMRTEFAAVAATKRLAFRVVPSSLAVHSDRWLVDRVLQHFVANAIRYTAKGAVLVGCRRRGGAVRIEVWDTGPGIPEEQRQAIFDPFYTVTREAPDQHAGPGLGLYLVRRIADLLGCCVDVQSVPGKGSVFAVELPRSARTLQAPAPAAAVSHGAPVEVVLMLRDAEARDALDLLFRLEGYTVRTVGSALLPAGDNRPALIVLDRQLDDNRSGLEVLQALRQAWNTRVPAIVLVEDASPAQLEEIDGIALALIKPVKAEDLLAHAARLLRDNGVAAPGQAAAPPAIASGTTDERPTVFVVAYDGGVRQAMVRKLIEVGHRAEGFADAEAFEAAFTAGQTGCVLLDLDLPNMGALTLQARLHQQGHDIPVLLLAGRRRLGEAVAGVQAGAVDVVEKPVDGGHLLEAVERALMLGRETAARATARADAEARLGRLTVREREILALLVLGHASKEIAAQLGISQRTVDNHRARIRDKTGARSRSDLVRLAGLVRHS